MRVLLVEDDPALSDAVSRHLRTEHFVVDVATRAAAIQDGS